MNVLVMRPQPVISVAGLSRGEGSHATSIRDAKAHFAEATQAAARGEGVVATKHDRPFVEMIPARPGSGMAFDRLDEVRRQLGLDGITVDLPEIFDDPAFSCEVLELES